MKAAKVSPKLAVAYLRVSKDTKVQELGAQAQRRAIQSWASAKGVRIAAWFEDEVTGSAPLDRRPGLLGALQAVKDQGAGLLLVAKRDRFTRDSLETAAVELELRRVGAELLAADGLGNGQDAASRLMAGVLDAVSEFERHTIKARIKAALAVKQERGERCGSIRYGFELAEDGVHLKPNQGEQRVLATMRELRQAGLTLQEVSQALAAQGMVNRKGKPFAPPAVFKMTQA